MREYRWQKCHDYPAENQMLLVRFFLVKMLPNWNCSATVKEQTVLQAVSFLLCSINCLFH